MINSLHVGGAERQLAAICGAIDRSAFDVEVLAFGDGPMRPVFEAASVPVRLLSTRPPLLGDMRRPGRWPHAVGALSKLRAFLSEQPPDIAHSYLLASNFLTAIALPRPAAPRFIVSRRSMQQHRRGRSSSLGSRLERWIARRADVVMCNSSALREEVIVTDGIDPARVRLIHNGIDVETYTRGSRDQARALLGLQADEAPVIGTVGNVSWVKGHADLIRALASVRAVFSQAVLVVVGEDRGIRADLEALATQCGVQDAVRFVGLRQDIPQLLPAFDAQAQCSYTEAFSNAVLEAGAAARPLVATEVGGNPEVVANGQTGLLVPPGDVDAIAAALIGLLRDRELAARLASALHARVVDEFSLEASARRLEALYRDVLS